MHNLHYDNKEDSSKENEENKGEAAEEINEEVSELKNIIGRQEEMLSELTHSFKDLKIKNNKLKYLLDETYNWKNSFAERNERLFMRFQKCIPEQNEGSQSSSSAKAPKIEINGRRSEGFYDFRKKSSKKYQKWKHI